MAQPDHAPSGIRGQGAGGGERPVHFGDRRLRIVALTTSFPRHADDHAGRFVHDLHAGLGELGHEVLTVCPGADGVPEEATNEAGRVLRIAYASPGDQDLFYGSGLEHNWRTARSPLVKLRRFLGRSRERLLDLGRDADLLVAHWIWPAGPVVASVARSLDLPMLGVGHGGDLHLIARPVFGRWLARSLRGRFDGVLCTSRPGAEVARRRLRPRRLNIHPMGADPARFVAAVSPPPGWPTGYLLGIGRLVPVKGFDLLVRAGALLGRPIVIAGEGPERPRLERLACATGASLHLPGWLPHRTIPSALAGAAAVAIPSRRLRSGRTEGTPVVAMEALLAGRPLVAARVGGLPDFLPEHTLFEPGDLRGLVARFESLGSASPLAHRPPRGVTRRDAANALLRLFQAS